MEKRVSCFIVAASCLLVVGLAGCGLHMKAASPFTDSGIPAKEFLAGGGFQINYVAPSDGTAYWVEETTQKILETRSVKKGEPVEFGGSAEPESVKGVLGIEMAEARFTFYFVPAKAEKAEE